MNWLARKAVLLVAPAAVGCAQLPTSSNGAPPVTRPPMPPAMSTQPVAALPPPQIGAPMDVARAAPPQEVAAEGQGPPNRLSPPRPVDALPPKEPSWANGGATLEELEELADRVNPTLRRDQAQIEVSRGQAVQAALFPNPRFDTNNPQVLAGHQALLNAGFQVEIPVAGKKNLDKSAANEGTRQAEHTFTQNRAALHAAIRQQFYAVLVDQERVRILTRLMELAKQTYDQAEVKKRAGEQSDLDVLTLRVAYQRAQGAVSSAERILEGDQKQLEAIIGEAGIIRGPLQGKVTGWYPDFSEEVLVKFITTHHTQIKIAESLVRQNRVLLRRAEVDPYPNPYLGPAYQFGLVPGNDQFWFNIQFSIPVWDRNQGNIRAAKANVISAHESVDVMRLNMVNQAQNILSQYRAARALVERFEGGVLTDVNRAAELARAAYFRGTLDRATLYQTQQAAAQANSDYLDALQNVWLNATQLSGLLQQEKFQSATTPLPGPTGTPGAPGGPKGPDGPPATLPMIPPLPRPE